jgi:drug/metabolite transporter (DMT)-like permease
MSQRTIDLWLAVIASVLSVLLSWPFWRAYEYWPESRPAWWLYFAIGFVLAIYVFYVFIRGLRTLSIHEGPGHDDDGEAEL